jgi:hypothetical protein
VRQKQEERRILVPRDEAGGVPGEQIRGIALLVLDLPVLPSVSRTPSAARRSMLGVLTSALP